MKRLAALAPTTTRRSGISRSTTRATCSRISDVTLLACENTMQNTKVGRDDIYGGVRLVQAGVTHIMKRQKEGWAYLRP